VSTFAGINTKQNNGKGGGKKGEGPAWEKEKKGAGGHNNLSLKSETCTTGLEMSGDTRKQAKSCFAW